MIDRSTMVTSIVDESDAKKQLNKREYNIVRNAIIDTLIKIYDDIESRVCENCKYFTYKDDNYNYCDKYPLLNGFVKNDFGCNRFKRKDNT